MQTLRTFVAFTLSEKSIALIEKQITLLKNFELNKILRWVPSKNYHLTVIFLGEVDIAVLEPLQNQIQLTAVKFPIREIEIISFEFFPKHKPVVLAAMIKLTDELNELHNELIQVIQQLHLPLDKKSFHPHISLGRITKFSKNSSDLILPVSKKIHIQKLSLMQSISTNRGPIYRAIQ